MKLPQPVKIEVDMVPLIDIISLLLMFLIIVGDASKSASAIQMRLPRADQGLPEDHFIDENRIVIQMHPVGGRYYAVINGRQYELARCHASNASVVRMDSTIARH